MVSSVFLFWFVFLPPDCTFSFRVSSGGICVRRSTAISCSCPSSKKADSSKGHWKKWLTGCDGNYFLCFDLSKKPFARKFKKKANSINDYFTFNCNVSIITKSFFSQSALWEAVLEGSFGRIIFLPQNEEYMSYIGLSLLFGLYDDLKFLLVDRNYL